ncbi:TetR/AcrR family transcriptional regulator [Nocardia sp. NPDC101769]|uniref:TetR/AcrR family transcriptional regulator n=1 Tax=Nocardia sp. NPDC101769 TaxID=3364333 RepID=UPI0038212FFC
MTTGYTDGRRARGQQRYQLVLDAALDLVSRDGLPALTTRALATAAGVSLASITYHFPTRADLVYSTCAEAVRRDIASTRAILDELRRDFDLRTASPAELADRWLQVSMAPDRRMMSVFSLYLEVVRQPDLAPLVVQWDNETRDLVAAALTEAGAVQPISAAKVLCAALDGLRLPLVAFPDATPTRADRDDLALLFSWALGRP